MLQACAQRGGLALDVVALAGDGSGLSVVAGDFGGVLAEEELVACEVGEEGGVIVLDGAAEVGEVDGVFFLFLGLR